MRSGLLLDSAEESSVMIRWWRYAGYVASHDPAINPMSYMYKYDCVSKITRGRETSGNFLEDFFFHVDRRFVGHAQGNSIGRS